MQPKYSLSVCLAAFILFVLSCKNLDNVSTTKNPATSKLLDPISLVEAQQWYNDILLKTPNTQNKINGESSGHPKDKEANFLTAYTYQQPNTPGNVVVAPLTYKGMEETVYLAGDEAKSGKPTTEDFKKKEINHLNNLIVYKQPDGRIESFVQRIISYDTKKKKNPEGVKWSNFSGEVQYYDWNENFLFGFQMKKGKMIGQIVSVSQTAAPNGARTQGCTATQNCFSYYACSRNPQTGALENCSPTTHEACYMTNIICVDTSQPYNGYSVPPGVGGTYIDPLNPAVAAIWDRGQVVNQIMNNRFSLLKNNNCPNNVTAWATLAQFIPPQAVINRIKSFNQTLWPQYGIQALQNAEGLIVNCDYFSVKVNSLPSGYSNNPAGFLEYVRKNLTTFTDGSTTFVGNPNIPGEQNKWINDPLGSILYLDVPGPQNGSVITSEKTSSSWTFSTIVEPYAGSHPVSGNRTFGYVQNSDGSYTYYCRGVDRVQTRIEEVVGQIMNGFESTPYQFVAGDGLWGSFCAKIQSYVSTHQGAAVVQQPVTKRPNWYDVNDVLNGVKKLENINCP